MKGILSKLIALKGPEKYTVRRRVRASFSPEVLQAGAVKGLRFREKVDTDVRVIIGDIFILASH